MSNHLYDAVFAAHADSTKTFLHTADRDISFAEFTAIYRPSWTISLETQSRELS